MTEDKEIDMCGLFCPEPVFRTKIEMEKLQVGDTLKITADDPAAEEDIGRWIKRTGHTADSSRNGAKITFKIKKVK